MTESHATPAAAGNLTRTPRRPRVERACGICGKVFLVWPSKVGRGDGKYCSRACAAQARRRPPPSSATLAERQRRRLIYQGDCKWCGAPVVANRFKSRQYCSHAHALLALAALHRQATEAVLADGVPREERYWPQVDRSGGPDACWPWIGETFHAEGYGVWHIANQQWLAHRLAYYYTYGRWPRPACLHLCEGRYPKGDSSSRRCCNPAHLKAGTQTENVHQMWALGRARAGEAHPMAKLTNAQVEDIRAAYRAGTSVTTLLVWYGVSRQTIHNLITGKTYRPA